MTDKRLEENKAVLIWLNNWEKQAELKPEENVCYAPPLCLT